MTGQCESKSNGDSSNEALLEALAEHICVQVPPDEHHAALVSLALLPWLPRGPLKHSVHTLAHHKNLSSPPQVSARNLHSRRPIVLKYS